MLASARRSNQRNFGGIEHLTAEQRSGIHKNLLNRLLCPRHDHLVPHFINTGTFATRDVWPRRGASDAHTLQGSVRSEQRRRGQKEPSPGGLRRFSVLASLLLGHSPTSGDAPSSRLARTENRRNKRGRIYEMEYLGFVQKQAPDRGRISNKTTLTLSLSRPTGEGIARPVARSLPSGWIRRPMEDDSPSRIRWERAGPSPRRSGFVRAGRARVNLPQNPELFLHGFLARHPAFAGNVFAAPFVAGATLGQQRDGQPQQQKQNYFSHGRNLIGIVSDASLWH